MTNLIELQSVQKLVELPVLAGLLELDVVLLETVESELRFVVNKDFKRLKSREYEHDTRTRTRQTRTLAMNFLQVTRISFESVALNIMTCLW